MEVQFEKGVKIVIDDNLGSTTLEGGKIIYFVTSDTDLFEINLAKKTLHKIVDHNIVDKVREAAWKNREEVLSRLSEEVEFITGI